VLETPRLILRPFRESDLEAAHIWFSDPEVFRFYTYGPYRSLEETAKRIDEYGRQFEKNGFGTWIVIDKPTGIPIGDAGLKLEEDTGEVHVGYKLARSYWGQGLATEAAQAWVTHGFDNLGLNRIAAFIHPQNAASIRVVQKLGFSFCRQKREAGIDWSVYELLGIGK
jgi:RimJ/RimL family protein N-acetyltransferase